ncbi:MAG: 2-C-methyl-D-erythritol 4-phosphate cytidylyltransferase [Hominenteromicrobium sp.]
MKIYAVIVAAGNSTRMQSGGVSKTMMTVGGEPVLRRTLRAFDAAPCIDEMVVVARACDFEAVREAARPIRKPVRLAQGGRERQDSVANGAAMCVGADYIAVHDGARPFVAPELIEKVCADAQQYGAATLAVPVKDTIKIATADDFVGGTPDRAQLRSVQTPQVFSLPLYERALAAAEAAGKRYTDDCQLIEAAGGRVFLTMGDYRNIKITTPEDLLVAESFAKTENKNG